MQNSTLIWIIVGALVVLGGGWYFLSSQNTTPTELEGTGEESQTGGMLVPGEEGGMDRDTEVVGNSEENPAPIGATVTYSASGFSPGAVTVRVGGTVTWTNSGSGQMWVASAQHPIHSAYDDTTLQEHCGAGSSSFDQCANGASFNFTFDKAGTWRYHNHSQASHFGTVIVE